ncbi:hypothetical protein R3W88_017971 [Solanum pinnatisectum]|uniref:Uncharacterized protein n=1 Tax=Solanum pinnatisectum TaxID=50273 RepID=A0AAV9L2I5_9SOLN|nr:hypothetical protein R3W88_017971 [Solanum pinnatisectum]
MSSREPKVTHIAAPFLLRRNQATENSELTPSGETAQQFQTLTISFEQLFSQTEGAKIGQLLTSSTALPPSSSSRTHDMADKGLKLWHTLFYIGLFYNFVRCFFFQFSSKISIYFY